MVVGSPDEVLWRYLALRERLGTPRTWRPVIDRGLVFGDSCLTCGASAKEARLEERDDRSGASRWVCAKDGCGAAWPVDLKFLLRYDPKSSPRPDGEVELFARLADLAKILDALLLREQRIYLLLYLYEGAGGFEEVARAANERWPTFRPPGGSRGPKPSTWSKHTVRQVVTAARSRINAELRQRGMGGILA